MSQCQQKGSFECDRGGPVRESDLKGVKPFIGAAAFDLDMNSSVAFVNSSGLCSLDCEMRNSPKPSPLAGGITTEKLAKANESSLSHSCCGAL